MIDLPYFLDTYAIIEFVNGNKKYVKYFKHNNITTKFCLMELYYKYLRDLGKKWAEKVYTKFLTFVVDFDDATIKEAMGFRLKMRMKGKKFSYTDAIGYIIARKMKVKFLTGDKEFRGLKNVKFVK
jgi:predicted nucleic acid-binding protein